MKGRNPRAPRIALALAGGGPLGAIYEIGALCALDESLEGLDLTEVEPGKYELVCLPLRLAGADGAPARAALRRAHALTVASL